MGSIQVERAATTWPLADDEPITQYLHHILTLHPFGLCTDIDGTISETAPTVDAAVLLPGMRELLDEATRKFELVATISGRAVEDQKRMIGVSNVWHVGHHGYEWEELDATSNEKRINLYPGVEPYLEEIRAAMNEIEAKLAPQIPGLWMERKGITAGIHWRLSNNWDQSEAISIPVIEQIAASHSLVCRSGRLAVELYPPIATNKGEGLRRLVKANRLKAVIYLGDEISDTDAFREIRAARQRGEYQGVAIGIVGKPLTAEIVRQTADIVIDSPATVKLLFQFLQRLRSKNR